MEAETGVSSIERIFVGNLGDSVISSDLERMFSSLGSVMKIEIIRTKGRHFAYVDFQPSSGKALGKLFSTYNGCTWKGNKLKIGKAKEHYLERLKRERAEEANLMNESPVYSCNKTGHSKDQANSEMEKLKLHIFFPRLKKVKVLPFSGSGKHKYSFPRVENSSLPVHFCDCEEHNLQTASCAEKHSAAHNVSAVGEVNEDEVNIMNSVLNKLFQATQGQDVKINMEERASTNLIHDILSNWDPDDSNEDNLVTNIMLEEGEREVHKLGPTNASKESKCNRIQSALKGKVVKRLQVQAVQVGVEHTPMQVCGRNTVDIKNWDLTAEKTEMGNLCAEDAKSHADTIKRTLPKGETCAQGYTSGECTGKSIKQTSALPGSHLQSKQHSELSHLDTTGTSTQEATQPISGRCWMQKSSWKDMVGERPIFSFSSSSVAFKEFCDSKSRYRNKIRRPFGGEIEGKSSPLEDALQELKETTGPSDPKALEGVESYQPCVVKVGDVNLQNPRDNPFNKTDEHDGQSDAIGDGTGTVCTFMRNAASVREFMKAKAFVNRSLKRTTTILASKKQ